MFSTSCERGQARTASSALAPSNAGRRLVAVRGSWVDLATVFPNAKAVTDENETKAAEYQDEEHGNHKPPKVINSTRPLRPGVNRKGGESESCCKNRNSQQEMNQAQQNSSSRALRGHSWQERGRMRIGDWGRFGVHGVGFQLNSRYAATTSAAPINRHITDTIARIPIDSEEKSRADATPASKNDDAHHANFSARLTAGRELLSLCGACSGSGKSSSSEKGGGWRFIVYAGLDSGEQRKLSRHG